jgi:Uma2 family endonuclease
MNSRNANRIGVIAMTPTAVPTLDRPLDPAIGDHYEVVNGQFVEKAPMGALECWLATSLVIELGPFVKSRGLGRLVSELLFQLAEEPKLRRRPDVAFVSAKRWPLDQGVPSTEAWEVVPDLVVEVVSPSNTANEVVLKTKEYFRAGVRLAWFIYPSQSQVYVVTSPSQIQVRGIGENLEGGDVVPGFQLPIESLFRPG